MVLNETINIKITTIMQNHKSRFSTGPYGISNEVLKLCSPFIEPYLCKIVIKCLKKNISWLSQYCNTYPAEQKMS